MCNNVHMKAITVRELHMDTGKWVRRAADGAALVVTDRRQPIACMIPYTEDVVRTPFSKRRLVPGFDKLPRLEVDSTEAISEDRSR